MNRIYDYFTSGEIETRRPEPCYPNLLVSNKFDNSWEGFFVLVYSESARK